MKHTKCPKCNKQISNNNYKKHVRVCNGVKKVATLQCDYCGKQYSTISGARSHEVQCNDNPNRIYRKIGKSWNRGLTKDSDERVAAMADTLKEKIAAGLTKMGDWVRSEEGRKRMSSIAKERGLGGYRPHPNRGVWYNGVWFDSKWEEKVAVSLDENNINWTRPKQGFVWTDNGNRYYPDFYLVDFDVYLDPKNPYLVLKDKEKIEEACKRNNIKVIVLTEEELSWDAIKELLMVRCLGKAEEKV